ncbi:hypothetical protein NM688_g3163 [Phlebia brevispora]|uniref:Uncharacterized protein n=1 Tax=Phlebia brevispora TaxID=194682 RepID=A0ACC1T6Y5_9APHY|nr:hypothetical protein NM688_g3163 [Phlebia brevispora]
MSSFMRRRNNAAKFAQLISAVSGDLYPNWHPSTPISVGDYGVRHAITKVFRREGSIYEDLDFATKFSTKDSHPTVTCPTEDYSQYVSREHSVYNLHAEGEVHHPFPEFAEIKFGGRWVFEKGAGAVLMLSKPTQHLIHDEQALINKLTAVEALPGRCLITRVVSCPTQHPYWIVMFRGKKTKVDIALALGVLEQADGASSMKWQSSVSTEYFNTAGEDGDKTFYPLYAIEKFKRKKRCLSYLKRMMQRGLPFIRKKSKSLSKRRKSNGWNERGMSPANKKTLWSKEKIRGGVCRHESVEAEESELLLKKDSNESHIESRYTSSTVYKQSLHEDTDNEKPFDPVGVFETGHSDASAGLRGEVDTPIDGKESVSKLFNRLFQLPSNKTKASFRVVVSAYVLSAARPRRQSSLMLLFLLPFHVHLLRQR